MSKIFISTTTFGKEDYKPLEYCTQGNEVSLNPFGRKISGEELIELASSADGLIAGTETLDKETLHKLPNLKVISRCGAGLDNVDLKAAAELGVKVFNTPFGPTQAVAELTVGLIIDLLRKISLMDRALRSGSWKKLTGNLLKGKNVGIIGFGRIGQKVAELLKPFDVQIAYYDICKKTCDSSWLRMEKNDLLSWADIITLHCSKNEKDGPLIGKDEISRIKPGSWLINTSRGGLVDEEALCSSLKAGNLSGAALDVFAKEPYNGILTELENVILTPHIGSYAKEGRVEMEMQAVLNLLEGLKIQ